MGLGTGECEYPHHHKYHRLIRLPALTTTGMQWMGPMNDQLIHINAEMRLNNSFSEIHMLTDLGTPMTFKT